MDVCCSSCSLSDRLPSHPSQLLSFVLRFIFFSSGILARIITYLLVAHATTKKEAEELDFFRLLGQAYWVKARLKARNSFRVFWHATRSHRATVQFGMPVRIVTSSGSLIRPRKQSRSIFFYFFLFIFLSSGGWGKNKALAHHTSTYFHTRRVSI